MSNLLSLLNNFAAACQPRGSFFGLPTWYKYLDGVQTSEQLLEGANVCSPRFNGIADVWLVGAAIIEILLRIAILAAIAYVFWGGVNFVTSQGEPDKTARAKSTIINALIGLLIALGSTAFVTFFAGRIN